MYDFRMSSFSDGSCVQPWVQVERHQKRYARSKARQLFVVSEGIRNLGYWWLKIWHNEYRITSALLNKRRDKFHHCVLSKMAMEVCLNENKGRKLAYKVHKKVKYFA